VKSDEELAGAVEKAMRAGEADCSCEEVARHLFAGAVCFAGPHRLLHGAGEFFIAFHFFSFVP
jgi:hypothetical protein